jgi:hypothetical protein
MSGRRVIGTFRSETALLALLLFGYPCYTTWFQAAPRLVTEWKHASDYVPAGDARILSIHCTDFDIAVLSWCDTRLATGSGRVQQLTDTWFGRAPHGRVQLMEWATVPPQYSTDLSLRTLHERLAVFILGGFLTLFFAAGFARMTWNTLRIRFGS